MDRGDRGDVVYFVEFIFSLAPQTVSVPLPRMRRKNNNWICLVMTKSSSFNFILSVAEHYKSQLRGQAETVRTLWMTCGGFFMASLKKRGRAYYAQYYENGKQKRVAQFREETIPLTTKTPIG